MFDTKNWWQSRTIWLQIVAAVFALLGGFKVLPAGINQEQVVAFIMAIVSVVTIILRLRSSKVIAPTPATPGPG